MTPSYARDHSATFAAAANPSPGSFGFTSAGAPPTKGLARGLFMAPQPTSAGGVAPAPALKPRASLSKLPNAAVVNAGKLSGKKNKAADGSSRRQKKKLAGRAMDATASEASAADVHNLFDEMPTSFNDKTYISTMGVGSNNYHWSQTNEVHLYDHEYEVDEDGEGIVDAPKERADKDEDILLCNTWLKVSTDATFGGDQSRDAYWIRMKEYFDLHNNSGIDRTDRSLRFRWSTINKGEKKKNKKEKIKKGRSFTLLQCYDVLKDDDKWKPREGVDEESNKRKRTIDLDDDEEEPSSDDGKRDPTPNSVAYSKTKIPNEGKKDSKEKKKRK
ncbi:putative receptor protein kinase ZmPK1 [Hordeum vulgare]|nr:putative receptor protein kinase ZmPK1 [Hordeum vulgare]